MTSISIGYILLAIVVAVAISYFQYFYKPTSSGKVRVILAFLRFLSVFTLILLLINPQLKSEQLEDVKPSLNVLIDNSSSIAHAKQEKTVLKVINDLKVNAKLQEKFQVHYFAFSDNIYKQDSFNFRQSETNILKALQATEAISKEHVAPILLITDGNQTYGSAYEFYKSKQAIYPIVVGDTLSHDDIKIHQINVNSYVSLKHKFPVEVFLQYDGAKAVKKQFTVQVNGKIVFKKILNFNAEKQSQKMEFYLLAGAVGKQHYNCKIETLINEKNTVNNINNFSVEVIDEQAKILILTTINHPDIGVLKRTIESNKQRKAVVISKLNKKIQLKDYQLVILYQPNIKFKKIFKALNKSSSNYFIITGTKTDWNFLNTVQPYFTKKNINTTEKYNAIFNRNFNAFITEDIGFASLPPLEDYFGDVTFSTDHQILLNQSISGISTENPLLATFKDRTRRGAVLFGAQHWKWRMLSKVEHQSFNKFDTFFAKLIQYLSSNKRSNQLEITYKPFVYANEDIRIAAQFFDANYVFDATANLIVSIYDKNEKVKDYSFTLTNNNYEAILNNLKPGSYTFSVSVKNKPFTKNGTLTVLPYTIEQQSNTVNLSSLKKLASASNGSVYYANQTQNLMTELILDKKHTTIQKSTEKIVSLVEFKWLLAILILAFSMEWFIRKYQGLI